MPTDADLLQRYVRARDERAFTQLVDRHLNLVYAAALRRTNGRSHMAEEIAQKVFTDLARKAVALQHHPALTGWLHRSTRYAAIDAARRETRHQNLLRTFTTMTEDATPPEPHADWENLRPVIDEAMDGLVEVDREAMLLRYFSGLSFAEVGKRMDLSENAARMRVERALDKLRVRLGKRGVTSTAGALGVLLADQALAQAPAGLATSVTATALAGAPAGAAAIFFTSLLFSKPAAATFGAACATGITLLAWTAWGGSVSDEELAALQAENARLKAVSVVTAQETTGWTGILLKSVVNRRKQSHAVGSGGHRNHGQATPYEAFLTFAWAIDAGESDALENILTYDAKGRQAIEALHASLPAAIRASYPTPEKFVVFLYLADAILRPLQRPDMLGHYATTEIEPGFAVVRRKGADRGGMKWIKVGEVWKIVVPPTYPEFLAKRILGNEMLDKLALKQAELK